MKNTKLYYIKGLLLLIVSLSSCEDNLETVPFSFTSPENFYKTPADAELAINGCYSVINDPNIDENGDYPTFSRGLYFILNAGTDEMVTKENFGNQDFAPWGLASFNSSNTLIRFNWFFWYAGINRVNLLLEKIDGIEMPAARKLEIKAEARFLRGFYYMYLAQMFGAVPVYTTSQVDPYAGRQPLREVYNLVLEDFKFAYENLNHRATFLGRANKWTAGGYLANVYCYLASCKKFETGTDLNFELNSFSWVDDKDMYSKALTLLTDVANNSGYTLINKYDYLFRETTASYQREECLFMAEAAADVTANKVNIWVNNLVPLGKRDVNGGGFGWTRALGEVYYKYTDGDLRRLHNLTEGIPNSGASTEDIEGVDYYVPKPLANINSGRYCQSKFRYQDPKQKSLPLWATGGNFPLLRYAEILLLKAEAEFFTGDVAAARNTITLVRERALSSGTTIEDLNTAYSKTDFVEELLDERTRELAFECKRRIDLCRFNKFTQVIESLSDNAARPNSVVPTLQANWQPYRIWIPLPLDQTDLNKNLLPNNPGY